jgi:hypothetical protein
MQKQNKKVPPMRLRRETLHRLQQGQVEPRDLAAALGGAYTYPPVCDTSRTAC